MNNSYNLSMLVELQEVTSTSQDVTPSPATPILDEQQLQRLLYKPSPLVATQSCAYLPNPQLHS